MPTRNVNLTNDLDRFVAAKVKSGRLRAAIDQGDASGIARGNVFGRVRKAIKLPVSR